MIHIDLDRFSLDFEFMHRKSCDITVAHKDGVLFAWKMSTSARQADKRFQLCMIETHPLCHNSSDETESIMTWNDAPGYRMVRATTLEKPTQGGLIEETKSLTVTEVQHENPACLIEVCNKLRTTTQELSIRLFRTSLVFSGFGGNQRSALCSFYPHIPIITNRSFVDDLDHCT